MRNLSASVSTIALAAILGAFQPGAARAVTLYSDLAAWEGAVGSFTETTSYGADFTDITGTTAGAATLTFGSPMNVRTIGLGWSTWCCGYTGQVLFSNGLNSVTWNISPVNGFGLFMEPDSFDVFDMTLTLNDGSTLTQAVNGNGGAAFFGWAGAGVTSLSLSTTDVDFAAGDLFTAAAAVPEPASLALLGTALFGFGALRRRSRKA